MADADHTAGGKKSKTAQAVAYYQANKDNGMSRYEAAKAIGIAPATLYNALKVIACAQSHYCPCCGQPMPVHK